MGFVLGILTLLLLWGTSTTAPYRLQAGDEIAVSVQPRKEFDCAGIVLPDGMVYLANVGGLKAAGLTVPELAEKIREVLDRELVNPRVTVSLTRLAPPPNPKPERIGKITVVGAVIRPGILELETGLRARRAIDLAGGVEKDADLTRILILHADLTYSSVDLSTDLKTSDPRHNVLLRDGDSVEVRRQPAARTAYARIGGAVHTPGRYELIAGSTVEDLILQAGKLTPLADTERVELRRGNDPTRVIHLAHQRSLGLAGRVAVQDGDEVVVPTVKDQVIVIGVIPNPGPKRLGGPKKRVREFFIEGDPEIAAGVNPALVDLGAVQLLRKGQPAVKLRLDQILKNAEHRENVELLAGDVLFLPPRKAPRRTALDYLSGAGSLGILFGLF